MDTGVTPIAGHSPRDRLKSQTMFGNGRAMVAPPWEWECSPHAWNGSNNQPGAIRVKVDVVFPMVDRRRVDKRVINSMKLTSRVMIKRNHSDYQLSSNGSFYWILHHVSHWKRASWNKIQRYVVPIRVGSFSLVRARKSLWKLVLARSTTHTHTHRERERERERPISSSSYNCCLLVNNQWFGDVRLNS